MFILLDIDGVMVTTPSWKKVENMDDDFSIFNQRAVDSLQRIVSETKASIILTTSHKSRFSNYQWTKIFDKRGISVTGINRLDDNLDHLNRKDEIMRWFNKGVNQSFVIIDDDKSLNDLPGHIKNKCVLTNSLVGLNDEATLKALSILQEQELALA